MHLRVMNASAFSAMPFTGLLQDKKEKKTEEVASNYTDAHCLLIENW